MFETVLSETVFGPKIENSRSPSGSEIFERDWKFQASHPPNPYFSWGFLKIKIEHFKRERDWEVSERDWQFSSEIEFFYLWALRVRPVSDLLLRPQYSSLEILGVMEAFLLPGLGTPLLSIHKPTEASDMENLFGRILGNCARETKDRNNFVWGVLIWSETILVKERHNRSDLRNSLYLYL